MGVHTFWWKCPQIGEELSTSTYTIPYASAAETTWNIASTGGREGAEEHKLHFCQGNGA